MERVKPVILIICDYYLPGFESGGAMRTLVNMVERLGDSYEFKIVTRDHDGPLNKTTYTDVRVNEWNRIENSDVFYLSKKNVRPDAIRQIINQLRPDAIYLNSFFSPLTIFTLLLRRFGKVDAIPIILAPEGELVSGALSIKPIKKQLYIRKAKLLKTLDKVVWKAASEFERESIIERFGDNGKIFIAPNMPPRMILAEFDPAAKPEKRPGEVKMVFLSRFMRKKNFNWLLDHVRRLRDELTIDIYGPIEDTAYWEECKARIKTLRPNIKIEAKGTVSHENVARTLTQYHFFVLPTLGENFGHIFVEALAAGCPLIISDRTPWRNLAKDVIGWDIPLEDPDAWLAVINNCQNMDKDDYVIRSENARRFAVEWLSDPKHEESNRKVLDFALTSG